MRIVGGDRLKSMMTRLGIPEDQPIEAKLVSSSIEQAQKKIEGLNFDTRKHVLEYDDIMGKQRSVIYKRRRTWLENSEALREEIANYIRKEISRIVHEYIETEKNSESEESQLPKFLQTLKTFLPIDDAQSKEVERLVNDAGGDIDAALTDYISDVADQRYEEKENALNQQLSQLNNTVSTSAPVDSSKSVMRQLERAVALQNLDTVWMQHLDTMSYLRDSVNLRSYGQRDPLVEYKREGYDLFLQAEARIESGIARDVYRAGVQVQSNPIPMVNTPITQALMQTQDAELEVESGTVGRNDPCPCGSGKKWKKCGLLNSEEHRSRMNQANA
jgi:preprotein translocase subunit SecA